MHPNQLFGLGSDGQMWRYRVTGVGSGWWASNGWGGAEIVVGSTGDGDALSDLVFMRRGGDNSIWVNYQDTWTYAGGWLSKMAAGDGQVFGLYGGVLKRYKWLGGTGTWLSEPSGFIGDKLAAGTTMNASIGDDVAYVLLADGSLRTWQPGA